MTVPPSAGVVSDNCGTTACDSSGNDHSLRLHGDTQVQENPTSKYGRGLQLDGDGDTLSNTGDQWALVGDLSVVIAVEIDEVKPTHLIRVNQISTGSQFTLALQADGHAFYNDGAGGAAVSDGTLDEGFYTFVLQRVDQGDGTGDVRVKAFDAQGFTVLDFGEEDRLLPGDNDRRLTLWVGSKNGNQEYLEGQVLEFRVWDRAVPQDDLDAIANPLARGPVFHEDTAEGTEEGLWFLGPHLDGSLPVQR